jgi:hypothetical protein
VEGGPARLRWMFLYRYVCVTSPTTWLFASDSHLIDSPSRLCTESLRLHSKCQRRNGLRFLARSRFFRRYFHVARE